MLKMIKWQAVAAFAGLVIMFLVLRYFTVGAHAEFVADRGGTYVEGVIGKPALINPLMASSDLDVDLSALIFSGMTRSNEKGEIVPDLAERWDVTESGKVWTFHLRPGVKWHDGAPFTADDVTFTINAIKSPDFPGNPNLADLWRNVEVEKLDDLTVKLTLKEPYTPFLNYTTLGIVPAHILSQIPIEGWKEADFNLQPTGTGRFRMPSKGVSSTQVVVEANPDYYLDRPMLDRIRFKLYPTREALLRAMEVGEVGGISYLAPDDIARVRRLDTYTVYTAPLSNYAIVFLNLRSPLFSDKSVRQALLYALDRDRIIRQVLSGYGRIAHSPILPTSWAHKDDIFQYGYEPEKAKSLLDSAGWVVKDGGTVREKDGQAFSFTLLTNDSPERVEVANMIRDQLATVGIRAEVKVVKANELAQDYLVPRKYDAALFGWMGLSNDPDSYQMWHSTQAENGFNFAGWKNDGADQLLEKGRQDMNQGERKQMYDEFQDIFAQEVPSLLLYYPTYSFAVSNKVHGVTANPMSNSSDRFSDIASWYMNTKRQFVSAQP